MQKESKKQKDNWRLVSMTGFGRASVDSAGNVVDIVIKSVNYRGLEIRGRFPEALSFAERLVLKEVAKHVHRGRIDIELSMQSLLGERQLTLDNGAAHSLISAALVLNDSHPEVLPLTMGDILGLPGIVKEERRSINQEDLSETVLMACNKALVDLLDSKTQEGSALSLAIKDIYFRCCELVRAIDLNKNNDLEKRFAKFKARVDELFQGHDLNLDRIYQEVALLVERSDFQEEIDRLRAHFEYFDSLCKSKESKGRKLDFLCQEMLRESNTLMSKAFDQSVTVQAIELKAEIERIREQVQNID